MVGVDYNLDNQDKAQAQTAAVLQANPDLKGVFGTNLFSAQGAYRAVVNAGLTGAVKIASWDAGLDQIAALKAGRDRLHPRPEAVRDRAARGGVGRTSTSTQEAPRFPTSS